MDEAMNIWWGTSQAKHITTNFMVLSPYIFLNLIELNEEQKI